MSIKFHFKDKTTQRSAVKIPEDLKEDSSQRSFNHQRQEDETNQRKTGRAHQIGKKAFRTPDGIKDLPSRERKDNLKYKIHHSKSTPNKQLRPYGTPERHYRLRRSISVKSQISRRSPSQLRIHPETERIGSLQTTT